MLSSDAPKAMMGEDPTCPDMEEVNEAGVMVPPRCT